MGLYKRFEIFILKKLNYFFQLNLTPGQMERNKTKEQLEEEKKISLSFRIKPLNLENMTIASLRAKAQELWDQIVKLETEKYDLEERQKRQDYDVSILYNHFHKFTSTYVFLF